MRGGGGPVEKDYDQQQTQPTYEAYGLELEAGPHWWVASALTIEPPPSLFFKLKLWECLDFPDDFPAFMYSPSWTAALSET